MNLLLLTLLLLCAAQVAQAINEDLVAKIDLAVGTTQTSIDAIFDLWDVKTYPYFLKSCTMHKMSWELLKLKYQARILESLRRAESDAPTKFVISFTGRFVVLKASTHSTVSLLSVSASHLPCFSPHYYYYLLASHTYTHPPQTHTTLSPPSTPLTQTPPTHTHTRSSVTAGHDSHFSASTPIVTGTLMSAAFAAMDITLDSRNVALGNNPCTPYDVCVKYFAGLDADIVHWEQTYFCDGQVHTHTTIGYSLIGYVLNPLHLY
jgi:hypothetical protein